VLELFKTKGVFPYLLLLVYTGLISAGVFTGRPEAMLHNEISFLSRFVPGFTSSPMTYFIFNFAVLFFTAIVVNQICNQNQLSQTPTHVPGMLTVLLSGLGLHQLYSCDLTFALLLLSLSAYNLLGLESNKASPIKVFNTSFFLALAGMFFTPINFMFFSYLIGLLFMQQINLRTAIQFILGFICPYFITLVAVGAISSAPIESVNPILDIWYFNWRSVNWSNTMFIAPALYILLFVLLLMQRGRVYYKRNVIVKRKINVLYLFMISAPLMLFFQQQIQTHDFAIINVYMGLLLGILLTDLKNKLIAEAIHLLILGTLVFLHHYLNI
jgi:hypothetical protein